jgi:hypothetical protein
MKRVKACPNGACRQQVVTAQISDDDSTMVRNIRYHRSVKGRRGLWSTMTVRQFYSLLIGHKVARVTGRVTHTIKIG